MSRRSIAAIAIAIAVAGIALATPALASRRVRIIRSAR
jgi:hypothetical protein